MTRSHDAIDCCAGHVARSAAAMALALASVSCSPTYDWREARPEGSTVTMLFPCRPSKVERTVRVAQAALVMQLHSCTAGGATFSLAVVDAGAPGRVAPLLEALRGQAVANVAGTLVPLPAAAVAGATPHPLAGRARIDGRLPDQRTVVEHVAWFAAGTQAYQATVLGTGRVVDAPTLDTFFDALRLR